MKIRLLLALFFISCVFCHAQSIITNSGSTFSPTNLKIVIGETINFAISGSHNVVEVSKAVWDANGNTQLPGGFSLPFGGGTINTATLSTGIHYYVCTPHAAGGMKGMLSIRAVNLQKPILTWTKPSNIPYETLLSGIQLNATANTPGSFTYTPALGSLLNAGTAQTLTVFFKPTDDLNFDTNGMSVMIDIDKIDPVLVWPKPADIAAGTELSTDQYLSKVKYPGSFEYNPVLKTVLEPGLDQTLSLVFKPSDTNNYNQVSLSTKINVGKKTPIIAWNKPLDIIYGTKLTEVQLNAGASTPGTFVYDPPLQTLLNAGKDQVLKLTFTPTDKLKFISVDKQTTITVIKSKPQLSWGNPEDIIFGMPLTKAHLIGVSDTDGTITFTPALGAIVDAGEKQILTMNFVPTDGTNFEIATRQVFIRVAKAEQTVTFTAASPLTFNESESLSANGLGAFTYNVQSGSASIINNNQLKANSGVGQCVVRATAAGDNNHNSAFAETKVNFQKANQTINFTAISAKKTDATPFKLVASSNSGLAVSFANKTPTLISLSSSTVTVLAIGDATIEATQAGDDNYLAAKSVLQSFNISLKPPVQTAINEFELNNSKAYPNPITNVLQVEIENNSIANIKLINEIGDVVMEQTLSQNHTTIDTGSLSNGIYFLLIKSGAKSKVYKLVK